MSPNHDCAQVERDNLDLYQALTTAVRQLRSRRRELRGLVFDPFGDVALQDVIGELDQVLERTSKPVPRPTTTPARGGWSW